MEIKVVKIVGKQSEEIWGQVHEFWPDDEVVRENKGKLFVVVELGIVDEQVTAEVGKEVLIRANETYYGSQGEVKENMVETVKVLEEEFEGISVQLAVLVDNTINILGGGAWVKVGDKEGWVIDPRNLQPNTSKVVSGKAVSGMVVVLGTKVFWVNLPLGLVRSAIHGGSVESEEVLIAELHKKDGGVGAILNIKGVRHADKSVVKEQEEEVENEEEDKDEEEQQVVTPRVVVPKKPFKDRLVEMVKKAKEIIPRESVYVSEVKPGGYKKIILVGVVFLGLFLALFVAGRVRNKQIALKNDVGQQQIEMVVHKYNEAKGLLSMNRDRSRELLDEVQAELVSMTAEQLEDERIKEIQVGMGDVLGAAIGTKKIELKEVVDLKLVRDDAVASKIAITDKGQLLVLDLQGDRIISVNLQTGSGKIIVGKNDIGKGKMVATYPDKYLVLGDKGVVVCMEINNTCSVGVAPDGGSVKDMKVWAGNIYTVDGDAGKIWKYPATETGYGSRQDWLADEENVAGGMSLALDGSIWVTKGASIDKYTGGVRDNFGISGLDMPLGNNLQMYTDENSEKLYIYDKDNTRIVIVMKTGEYLEQWKSETLGNINDFVVDTKTNKVYFATDSRIMSYEGN